MDARQYSNEMWRKGLMSHMMIAFATLSCVTQTICRWFTATQPSSSLKLRPNPVREMMIGPQHFSWRTFQPKSRRNTPSEDMCGITESDFASGKRNVLPSANKACHLQSLADSRLASNRKCLAHFCMPHNRDKIAPEARFPSGENTTEVEWNGRTCARNSARSCC